MKKYIKKAVAAAAAAAMFASYAIPASAECRSCGTVQQSAGNYSCSSSGGLDIRSILKYLIRNSSSVPGCNTGNCQQTGTSKPDCAAGNCQQTGTSKPDCAAGNCQQTGTSKPGCTTGNCQQTGTSKPDCAAGNCQQTGTSKPGCTTGNCPQTGTSKPDCAAGNCQQTGTSNSGCTTGNCQQTGTEDDYTVSEYEKEVVRLINEIRSENGLAELKLNTELSKVARLKSEDMRDNHYFSHTSPTYGSPFEMMKSFGITYRSAGENIASGQRTPAEVVRAWMNSSGHKANILNSSFKEIGMGYVPEGRYWTQMFIG